MENWNMSSVNEMNKSTKALLIGILLCLIGMGVTTCDVEQNPVYTKESVK